MLRLLAAFLLVFFSDSAAYAKKKPLPTILVSASKLYSPNNGAGFQVSITDADFVLTNVNEPNGAIRFSSQTGNGIRIIFQPRKGARPTLLCHVSGDNTNVVLDAILSVPGQSNTELKDRRVLGDSTLTLVGSGLQDGSGPVELTISSKSALTWRFLDCLLTQSRA